MRFADDIVILPESREDLGDMLNGMELVLKSNYGMSVNKNKTMGMECS